MSDYPIVIFWSEADDGYAADIPDLQYCSAVGATPQEALEQVLIAKEAWLAVAREDGMVIPPPSSRPPIHQAAG
jgi:predicted RNase H-like HicB family nuclease